MLEEMLAKQQYQYHSTCRYMFLFTIIINGSAFKSIQTCKHNYVIYTKQINNNNKLQ